MKTLLVLFAFASAAAAAPLKCADGNSPRLTGDLFAPVECSSAALPVAALTVPPANPQDVDLKALEGAYEGPAAIQDLGRYDLRLEFKKGWFGRATATLKLIELQSHALSSHTLKLVPAKGTGRYAVAFKTDALPGRKLKGEATAGARRLDLLFANGARDSVRFDPAGPDALRAQIWWAVPGAPPRTFETALTRVPSEKP